MCIHIYIYTYENHPLIAIALLAAICTALRKVLDAPPSRGSRAWGPWARFWKGLGPL